MERAAIDRIEEGRAVLLVGAAEREMIVPLSALPQGAAPGHWLRIEIEGGELRSATLDPEQTARRQSRLRERLARLLRLR